ncbi:CapA family protein [Streptomyces sp. GMY01]|uniref:CapA family protein n=1 Tax=Streptomyces sp. GMY02 TaxID=1333528 RepID=UPI00146D3951|nr:CapA family protein [Streptomyces sp. GMY02]NMO33522.1 CapA family protein [Streptomyces sp. GMY02]
MIARRHQVALAVTALLAAGAACRAELLTRDAAPPRPAPAPPGARAGAFTLVASGSLLADGSAADRAAFDAGGAGHDFRPMLADVRPLVAGADLALCHLDTVLGASGPRQNGPLAPPELAEGLAATGYDGCATASEHTLDDGGDGVRRTLDALDEARVRHAGSARAEAEARGVALLGAGSALVAHLSYSDGTDRPFPPGQPWALNLADADRIVADARAARTVGADVVVVSLDWGTRGQDRPDARQLDLARRLTAARDGERPAVDLVLGGGAHAPQPYEKVNGTWVVYGAGDQITGGPADARGPAGPRAGESTLARFTFAPPARPGGRWEVVRAEFVPTLYDRDAGRVVDLGEAIARGADLEGVRERIRATVLARGAAKDGLVMGR